MWKLLLHIYNAFNFNCKQKELDEHFTTNKVLKDFMYLQAQPEKESSETVASIQTWLLQLQFIDGNIINKAT